MSKWLDEPSTEIVADPAQFDTKLSSDEEPQFQRWKARYAPKDSGADYDLRGAYKAGLMPDTKTGHWPDTFKKPNHPTFSDESKYARFGTPGKWTGPNHDVYVPGVKQTAIAGAKWLDEPDTFDKEIVAGTNTPGQILSGIGKSLSDIVTAPLDRITRTTDIALGGKGKTLSKVSDTGVQLADMVAGLPGDAAAKVLNAGTRFAASRTPGVSQKLAGQAGEEAEQLVPDWLKSPMSSLKQYITGKQSKEGIPISKVVDSFANAVEKHSDGWVTSEDAKFILGGVFDTLGAAGLHTASIKLVERAKMQAALAEKAKTAEAASKVGPPVPEDLEIRKGIADQKSREWNDRLAAQEQLLNKIDMGPEIPEAAVAARNAELARQQWAREHPEVMPEGQASAQAAEQARARYLEENPEFAPPKEEAAPLEPSATSVQASPTLVGQPRPSLETALEKVKAKQLALLSSEERIALRGLDEAPQVLDAKGNAPARRQPNFGQAGGIDPKLLAAMGAVGGGAVAGNLIGDDLRSTLWGAAAGLALGTGKGREMFSHPIGAIEDTLGNQSTTIRNISSPILRSLRDLDMKKKIRTQDLQTTIAPFVRAVDKLPKVEQEAARNAMLNGDWEALAQKLGDTVPAVKETLQGIGTELKGLKRFKEGVADYFPRKVKDFEGLKNALGQPAKEGIDRILAKETAKLDRPLTDLEQSVIIDRWMKAPENASSLPGFAKERRVGEVTPELQKFYETPDRQLLSYVSEAASDIETAKFFGKDLVQRKQGGKEFTDVDASIGQLIQRELGNKNLTAKQVNTLREQLRSIFVGGEKAPAPWLQNVRNVSNTALLGNVKSALTQIGDPMMAAFYQGLPATLTSLVQQVKGKPMMTRADLGLVNTVMEELGSQRMTGEMLTKAMKVTGFQGIDALGKGTNANAAFIKNQRLAAKNPAAFQREWGKYFGEDTAQLMADLQAGAKTPLTKSLVFSELSDIQPISNLEMPKAYNDNPNARLLWQVKSYMLKQADVVRRKAYEKIVHGEDVTERAQGVKNLAVLGAGYALSQVPGDAIKAALSGQPYDITSPDLVENMLQTFGLNRYATDYLRKGNPKKVAQDFVTPPVVGQVADTVLGKDQAVRSIPIAGPLLYDWFFGGNERKEISERQRKPKDERPALSPAAKEYQRGLKGSAAEVDEMQGVKSMRAIQSRAEYRAQEREELLREAYRRWGKRGAREFLAADERAEMRKLPKRREGQI